MTNTKTDFDETAAKAATIMPYILVTDNIKGGKNIIIKDLTVRTPGHNGVELVKNLDMDLQTGDRVILTGASGTGKTTVAKALLNQWDYGDGLVIMPTGIKIMSMSQQPHFPNSNLRSIMNMRPADKCTLDDKDLRKALQAVGRDIMIQHIPGQQVEMLMDDLKPLISEALTAQTQVHRALHSQIKKMVGEQFQYVQYTPDAQRAYMHKIVDDVVSQQSLETSDGERAALANLLVNDIDIALADAARENVSHFIHKIIRKKIGGTLSLSPSKAAYLSWATRRALKTQMKAFLSNDDTDDKEREIRLNTLQAASVVDEAMDNIDHIIGQKTSKSAISGLFNAMSWPLSAFGLALRAKSIASDVISTLTYFMDRQVVTGDQFKSQLSGGEKQKLMIAMVLLHQPDVLILDEITAALDQETGERLYQDMMEKLPKDTIVVSIAHNKHIIKYHTHHATLADQTVTMEEINPNKPSDIGSDCTCDGCPSCPQP